MRLSKVLMLALGVACVCSPLIAQQNVLTWKYDNTRLGVNTSETTLTPANVNSTSFGLLFHIYPNAGKPDPQPLYVANLAIPGHGTHNVLFVETEKDYAFAYDADTGVKLWETVVLATGETPSDDRGVGSVTPVIGVTATPVIDLAMGPHGTEYLVAMSKDAAGNYHHRLHALDITTGAEEFNGPVEIAATYPGSGANAVNGQQVFNPAMLKEQAALTLVHGTVVTTWSSHDDTTPYNGWVIGYDEATLKQTQVLCVTPNGLNGSIWMARSGPAVGASGSIYMLVANGSFDATLDANGFPSKQDYGNSMVKMTISGSTYKVEDYFTMYNVSTEDRYDLDLGSGGIMLLPAMKDAGGVVRNLVIGAGKDTNIYLADIKNMGKFNATTNQIYQEVPAAYQNIQYASPTFFNGNLFYATTRDVIRVFQMANAKIVPTPIATSATAFQLQGANLIVSANGTKNGILWAIENQGNTVNVLHAYDATNFTGGVVTELYNSTQAAGNRDYFGVGDHFVTPLVVNGKVYAASANGIGVFGLLAK